MKLTTNRYIIDNFAFHLHHGYKFEIIYNEKNDLICELCREYIPEFIQFQIKLLNIDLLTEKEAEGIGDYDRFYYEKQTKILEIYNYKTKYKRLSTLLNKYKFQIKKVTIIPQD